jgi:hypothetical protein
MEETGEVRHDEEGHRFELTRGGETGYLTYALEGGTIRFTHTIVPPALEGHGVGSRIVRAGLDHARAQELKVVPQCSFVRGYIERHRDYADLVA